MKREIESNAKSMSRGRTKAVQTSADSAESTPQVDVVRTALAVTPVPHASREQLIAEAAYHHAEARGFEPGHELDDWLAAEAEVDARLCSEGCVY